MLPGEWRRMVNLIAAGDITEARKIHYRLIPITNALFMESNPAPAKAALDIMGICSPHTRLPLLPATDSCRAVLREELSKLGII